MITLAHPWLLWLLPLPLLIVFSWPAHREPRPSLHIPFLDRLARLSGLEPGTGATILRGVPVRSWLLGLSWLAAVTALARPQWLEPPVSHSRPLRDLLVAVDLSGSMATRDFTDASGQAVERLTAVKTVLDDFLARRQGDRVGLVFFGNAAFVQAPFTEDLPACRQLLAEAQVGMAGPQTAFGDAIGLAVSLFERSPMQQKVLIVLTDGNDTASQIPPAKAAEIAARQDIVIHTVSVGDPRAAGEQALDVPTLQQVARQTGGLYSAATDRSQLTQIYARLDALESHRVESVTHRPRRDLYYWALAAGFLPSLLYQLALLLRSRLHRKSPAAVPAAGKEALA